MKKYLLILLAILPIVGWAQDDVVYETKSYKPHIKTVKIHRFGDDLSFPIIDVNSRELLQLSFDDLESEGKTYYYNIIHCDAQWKPSNISEFDYIDGYFENQIYDYTSSYNTLFDYDHYTLQIPNDDVRLKISGNYIIKVYEDGDKDNIVLTARFMLIEPQIDIEAKIDIHNAYTTLKNQQEFNFTIKHPDLDITNPAEELQVVILQNDDWSKAMINPSPTYIGGDEIRYEDFNKLVFDGGNEYRFFNSKNINYAAENIERVDFMNDAYHFLLIPDHDRTFEDYIYREELNGLYKVDKDRSSAPETDADYVYVYFSLQMENPLNDAHIYLYGDLTNRQLAEHTRMIYNFDTHSYEKRALLKQGYYNYTYILQNHDGSLDYNFINGNKYQTENDYTFLVYHRDMRAGYDKLVGITHVNSQGVGL